MESVMVEMWVSVIDVPPRMVEVVEVYRPGISRCLMNEVSPMTNSQSSCRMPLAQCRKSYRSPRDRGRSPRFPSDPDQVVFDRRGLGILAEDPGAAPPGPSTRNRFPSRAHCGKAAPTALFEGEQQERSPAFAPAARNSVVSSVLPVPVGPETRITESRKKPPPSIASSSSLPEVMGAADDFCLTSRAESGITTMPWLGTIVSGHSPFWWVVPRNLRISTVRRRTSACSELRR